MPTEEAIEAAPAVQAPASVPVTASDIWDDATNAVCQHMQDQGMCNCPDGDCLAAKVQYVGMPHYSALAAPVATQTEGWQPIETAPRDGTPVLLFLRKPIVSDDVIGWMRPDNVQIVVGWAVDEAPARVALWNAGFCYEGTADSMGYSSAIMWDLEATHWMPLPAAPTPAKAEGEQP